MLIRTQRRTLIKVHGEMASALSTTLAEALSSKLYVGLLGSRVINFGDFIEPLPDPSFIFNFSVWAVNPETGKRAQKLGWAVFDMDILLALKLLGTDESKPRPFTNADLVALRPVIRNIIRNIKAAWSDAVVVEISDIELKNRPRNIKVLQEEDFVAVVDMEIDLGTQAYPLALCYPIPLINKLLNGDG